MVRTYDIFEIEGGQPIWRACVDGHEAALAHAKELAQESGHEIRVRHLPDQAIIAIVNQAK